MEGVPFWVKTQTSVHGALQSEAVGAWDQGWGGQEEGDTAGTLRRDRSRRRDGDRYLSGLNLIFTGMGKSHSSVPQSPHL